MRDTLTVLNHRDFRQRYEHTYGFYTTSSGKKLVVKFTSVKQSEVKFVDKDNFEYTAKASHDVNFEFSQVPKGWFNGGKQPYFVCRFPARQYQRGIANTNTNISTMDGTHCLPNFDILEDIFFNNNYNQSIEEWMSGARKCVALNKHFAIDDKQNLYLFQEMVGKVDKKAQTIECNCEIFRQEVSDINNRLHLGFRIK